MSQASIINERRIEGSICRLDVASFVDFSAAPKLMGGEEHDELRLAQGQRRPRPIPAFLATSQPRGIATNLQSKQSVTPSHLFVVLSVVSGTLCYREEIVAICPLRYLKELFFRSMPRFL